MNKGKRRIEDIYYKGDKLSKIISDYYERGNNIFYSDQLILEDLDLSNTILSSDIILNFVKLKNVDLTNCLCTGCDFNGSHFIECDFTGTLFSGCQFKGCAFSAIAMQDTYCDENNFAKSVFGDNCCFDKTTFKHCNLADCYFGKITLTNINFFNSNLFNATFNDSCTLRGNSFDFSNITDCSFYKLPSEPAAQYMKGKILTEPIIGYKKCKNDIIVKLEIPRGAIVFSINGKKCRTNKAKVVEIIGANRAISTFTYMSYYVGDEFTIYDFNCQYNNECSSGIHFFTTLMEAVIYQC